MAGAQFSSAEDRRPPELQVASAARNNSLTSSVGGGHSFHRYCMPRDLRAGTLPQPRDRRPRFLLAPSEPCVVSRAGLREPNV